MGNLESESRKRRKKGQIQYAVLASIGIAGMLLVSMAVPNVLQLLGTRGNRYRLTHQAKTALGRLAQSGDIKYVEQKGKRYARITESGERRLLAARYAFGEMLHKRWDKRWRLMLFDIPERRRKTRDSLRKTMKSFGFYRLQDSAWIYPHDCEDAIALLKADLKIGSSALYMIVDSLENDKHLRAHFELH